MKTFVIAAVLLAFALPTATSAAKEPGPLTKPFTIGITRDFAEAGIVVGQFFPKSQPGNFGSIHEKRDGQPYVGTDLTSQDGRIRTRVAVRTPIIQGKVHVSVDSNVPVTLRLYGIGHKPSARNNDHPGAAKEVKLPAGRQDYYFDALGMSAARSERR